MKLGEGKPIADRDPSAEAQAIDPVYLAAIDKGKVSRQMLLTEDLV